MNEQETTRATGEDLPSIPVETLIQRLRPFIERRVRHRLRCHPVTRKRAQREDVEDLVQDVFAHLFADDARVLALHDPRRMDLLAWVHLIADRLISSTLRSPKRNPCTLEPTDEQTLEGYLEPVEPVVTENKAHFLGEVERRAGPKAKVVLKNLLEGRKMTEISALTGMSPNAVHKACERLRKLASIWTTSDDVFPES